MLEEDRSPPFTLITWTLCLMEINSTVMTDLDSLLTSPNAAAAAAALTEKNFHSKVGKSCFTRFINTTAPIDTPALFVSHFTEIYRCQGRTLICQ